MTYDELKQFQEKERQRCLEEILQSKAPKKVIVAGPGTGKTFTFGKLLKGQTGNKLAMTFIKKLVSDMEPKLAEAAEVKTFHAYCKKILHEQNGKVEIAAFLTKVVEKDAALLERGLREFDSKFQTLDENAPELIFHLARGDYYSAVGFDDSVYRLLKLLREKPDVVPTFAQIVIDEFQDFHSLEVAFIEELSKKGAILIVGDDDQAVYDRRNASPQHLRDIYERQDFERFDLPYCSRCPEVIVKSTNALIDNAQALGFLQNRIPKKYECYLADKEKDNERYPHIIFTTCTVASVIPKYIEQEIAKIPPEEIAESNIEGDEYPTVLIVGPKHYLTEVEKYLRKVGLPFSYKPSGDLAYGIVDAYVWLLRDEESNLGWRILLELFFDEQMQRKIISQTEDGAQLHALLPKAFIDDHRRAIQLIRGFQREERTATEIQEPLREILKKYCDDVLAYFAPNEPEADANVDRAKPSILLTSFVGCKGLAAGHVFIIGAQNGCIPKNPNHISDVEISQFIVALTRTRKRCHVLASQWLVAPVGKDKKPIKPDARSIFLEWIPKDLIEDRGKMSAKSFA